MRLTDSLADILARYREPGRRQIAVVTHAQHAYEITPETVIAVDRLRKKGIPVYNQLVYTFFASRRFEAVFLRRTLTKIGIDPYYTFNTKGMEDWVLKTAKGNLYNTSAAEFKRRPVVEK